MAEAERILIADADEASFRGMLESLQRAGFQCDAALDRAAAERLLREGEYWLLIADLGLPGLNGQEPLGEIHCLAQGLPVILITSQPSLEEALRSLRLRVVDYLIKPLDQANLLMAVHMGFERSQTRFALRSLRERLEEWRRNLEGLETCMLLQPRERTPSPLAALVDLSFGNIAGALLDLKSLFEAICREGGAGDAPEEPKRLRPPGYRETLEEVIDVLEKTKGSFKSKDLGQLRLKLKTVLTALSSAQKHSSLLSRPSEDGAGRRTAATQSEADSTAGLNG